MSRNQRRNKRNKQGGTNNANRNATRNNSGHESVGAARHRSSTETKHSLKTTELIAYAGAVIAVVMTALAVDGDADGSNDPFGAESAIRYITYLTIGYLLARGLAKSWSHENYVEHHTDIDDDTARTDVVHDDDERVGDADADRVDDGDVVETVDAPSDPVQRPTAEDVDSRP